MTFIELVAVNNYTLFQLVAPYAKYYTGFGQSQWRRPPSNQRDLRVALDRNALTRCSASSASP